VETYGPVNNDEPWNGKSIVIEIVAAVVGAVIGIAGVSAAGMGSRNRENREEAVRLTVAVESIAERLDSLHIDMKADRSAIYKLLNEQGNRITALESRPKR
jgi:outer membrane murein-binding lipoprotein Lpp